jgi:predicted CXXCH cytochrome family protein
MPSRKSKSASHRGSRRTSPARQSLKLNKLGIIVIALLVLGGAAFFTGMQFENRDSFCASCHTQPESTYFQRESGQSPVDLATFHEAKSVRCIDCHSGKGIVGRMSAIALGTRDLLAFLSRNFKQPAPLTRSIGDTNCYKCHADIGQRQDFNNHFHVFLPQWQARDPNAAGCVDCHQSHNTNGQASLAFLNQSDTTQVCQRCHNFAGAGG